MNTHSPLLSEYFLGAGAAARIVRCSRHGRETLFETLDDLNLLSASTIADGLADDFSPPLASTFAQRMVRGDFR